MNKDILQHPSHTLAARLVVAFLLGAAMLSACQQRHTGDALRGDAFDTVAQCRAHIRQTRQYMADGHDDKALLALDSCIRAHTSNAEANDSLADVVSDALVTIVNIYQADGHLDACIQRLLQYRQEGLPMLKGPCRRDLAVVDAYALSRTEATDEAARLMDAALKMKANDESHSRLFRDYAYAAAVYYCVPERQTDAERYGRMGIKEANLSQKQSGKQWLMTLMGQLYKRNGDLASAVELYSESYDEAARQNDTLGLANACNSMADLLAYWHLSSEADRYASRAVSSMGDGAISTRYPMVTSSIYITKAKTCKDMDKPDSALFFLDKAQAICKDLPYNSGQSDIDLVRGTIQAGQKGDARRRQGISLLDKVAMQGTPGIRCQAYFSLAKAFDHQGESALVDKALDSLYHIATTSNYTVAGAYEYAIDYALRTDNVPMLKRFTQVINNKERMEHHMATLRKVSASIVKFDTDKKERELALQASELHRKSSTYFLLIVTLLVIVAAGIVVFFTKRRATGIQQRLMEEKLRTLSDSLEKAIQHESEMHDRLKQHMESHKADSQDATGAQTANADARTGKAAAQDGSRETAPAPAPTIEIDRMRDNDGEAHFRELFAQIHPHFLARLHSIQPNISRKEELLCMLIVLGKDSAQIENILCIARNSVNMARYRLRQKLALTRNDSLDQYLRSLISNP